MAQLGVDFISVGAITKSIQAIDLSLLIKEYFMMPSIVFTGGGTAGHVAPNMALIHEFSHKGWEVRYIGSAHGIEKDMITTSWDSISCSKQR